MNWLLVAIIVLAQQRAEAPKRKGASETYQAKSATHAQNAQSNQPQTAQPSPATVQTTVSTESQRNTAAANNHTQTGSQQTSDEDRSTQRKLTWFTGILAGVGVLQLVVMFLTWLVYR